MHAEIICLLETRVKEIKAQNVMTQFVEEWSYCWNYSCLDNGRIWVLWRKNLQCSVLKVEDHFISTQGYLVGRSVVVSTVYGSNNGVSRNGLWNKLSNVSSLVGSNIWLVGGDLNITAEAMESSKYEDGHLTSEMEDLRNCMTYLGLVDHPFLGMCLLGLIYMKRASLPENWIELWLMINGVRNFQTVMWSFKPLEFLIIAWQLLAFNKRCFANITEKVAEKRIQLEKQQLLNLSGEILGDVAVKRKRNTIRVLVDEGGNKLETFDSIADELVNYFTRHIGSVDDVVQGCTNNLVVDLLGYTLPACANEDLVKPVTNDEIKMALWNQGKDKALGPDGYTVGFFQYAWDIIRVDFIADVRLVGYLPEMIAPNQSAFVRGRNIESNTLLAQELVRGYERSSISPRCAIKADLQKAFDSLSWKFLLAVLKGLGLPEQFRGWIEACVMDSRFSIILNGSLVGYFRGRRGVSQGDPLSPYLFIIAMNIMSKLLDVTASEKKFSFILSAKDLDSIVGVKCVLDRFYVMSGLRLNVSKIEIYIVGINERQRTLIQETTGFTNGCLLVRYLGVPLVPRKLTEKDCTALVEKIKAKLGHWSNR
ncbi:uncharacterized protein LOC120191366 [Hibiscus syriacus]|uniref:uncharacterized protein LOC120191366 n=1 Tax=Hibiscus syriacus TaxID=106335 RepID=UPI0019216C1F|nr:uncharacterized protein LOC120191366 [Hibiscus syriacus]